MVERLTHPVLTKVLAGTYICKGLYICSIGRSVAPVGPAVVHPDLGGSSIRVQEVPNPGPERSKSGEGS